MKVYGAADVIAWIEANVPHNPTQTPREQALWWAAYRSAQSMHDSFTIKDWARMLLDGSPPIQGDEDIQEVVDGFFYDPENPTDEEAEQVEENLRDFWDVKENSDA